MEEKPQVDDTQAFSRQHANGEVFAAENIEAARGMCPVLGKMSLDEAGLLLELEAMGKEQLADKPDLSEKVVTEKQIIERIQTVAKPKKETAQKHGHDKTVTEVLSIITESKKQVDNVVELTTRDLKEGKNYEALVADLNGIFAQREPLKAIRTTASVEHKKQRQRFDPVERRTAEVVTETNAVLAWTRDITGIVQSSEENARHTEGSVSQTFVLTETSKVPAHYTDLRPVLAQPAVDFIDRGAAAKQEKLDDVELEAAPLSIDELFQKNVEEQLGYELGQPNLAEENDAVEMREEATDYDFFEEDNVNLIMAELKQNRFETAENSEVIAYYPAKIDTTRFTHAEVQAVTSVPELPAPVEEIEATLLQLAEVLAIAESNLSQHIDQIVREIIALPDKLEQTTEMSEEVFEQKLEILFEELFDQTGIQYTQEVIISFVKLTQAHYLEKLLPQFTEGEEKVQKLSDEVGTREFLQKLQLVLTNTKQAVVHFYEIGKSVMRLYSSGGNVPRYAENS